MAVEFDPYHKWLGIPPAEQPANFYRLLALNPFESDPDVIEAAADARISHLRSLQTGKFGDLTQPLLNEVTSARLCLLKPERRATYDASLRAQLAARYAGPPPPPPPEPVASPEPVQASAPAEAPAVAQSGSELLDFISADGPGGSGVDAADWSGVTGSTGARSMSGSALVRSKKNAWPQMFMIFGPVLGIVAVAIAIMIHNGQEADDSITATNANSSRGAAGSQSPGSTGAYSSSTRPATLPHGKTADGGFSSPSQGVNRPAAYLDDLRERDVKIGFGTLGKHGATGYPPEEVQRVQTDGRYVAHALSMHPRSNGSAQVSYALGGKYQSFSAVAALMSSATDERPATPLQFRVLGDAKILWSSPKPLESPGERVPCTVSVHGVMLLTLEVICPGPASHGHAAWIDPLVSIVPHSQLRPAGELVTEGPKLDMPSDKFSKPQDFSLPDKPLPGGPTNPDVPRPSNTVPEKPVVDTRTPVPSAAARQKALAEIRNLFKDDYAKAGSPDGRRALAKKLAKFTAEEKSDEVMRYVMANESLDLAVRVGDAQLASKLVSGLCTFYAVDSWELRAKTLTQLSHLCKTPEQRAEIAQAALDLVGKAEADKREDAALDLATLAANLSQTANNAGLRDQARDARERIRRTQKLADDMKVARKTLADSPGDPAANLTLGLYLCLEQANWSDGLPYLAKANDPLLKTVAAQEQALPSLTADRENLADAWWTAADNRPDKNLDPWIKPMRVRAAFWYHACQGDLKGLELLKAQKRISDAEEDHPAAKPAAH